jgi:hypothetical protein
MQSRPPIPRNLDDVAEKNASDFEIMSFGSRITWLFHAVRLLAVSLIALHRGRNVDPNN